MLKTLQQRNRLVKIVLGVILVAISLAMVITLVPGPVGTVGSSPDTVAVVGKQEITIADVRRRMDQETRGQSLPPMLRGLYLRQVLDQIIFQKSLEIEARRLGLRVTPEEEVEQIKQLLPTVFTGDTWVGQERYAQEVQLRTGMAVPEFERFIRQSLLREKFWRLVTDGISVSPEEVQQEFRRRNEKVQIEYARIKPADLISAIEPTDAEITAYFNKNQSRYQVPERRAVQYALLDLSELKQRASVTDDELRAYYNQHIDRYKVPDRVHVEHILFKTVGKTDAEIAEIKKHAEAVLKKAKQGANFGDLAKMYSEDDATKLKGGDLGWIVRGQTVPEFEQVAFSLPKGEISGLVKTQYGFHIIKVLDRETAHTKSFDEVRSPILSTLLEDKTNAMANGLAGQMASAVRESNRQSLERIAKQFALQVGETPPMSVTDPVGDLGNSADLQRMVFSLRPGELSAPIRIDRGYVVLTVKSIEPAHQGTLAEVRDKVLADYRRERSLELARSRTEELAGKVRVGEPFTKAAKSLGIEVKTSDPFARTGAVEGLGSAQQLDQAFKMDVGQVTSPFMLGNNWVVFRIAARVEPKPDDLVKQQKDILKQLLQDKQNAAFEAFRRALESRLRREGKVVINADALKRLTNAA